MTGLPKAIIRKYGVTKKAWSVFRGNKRHSKKTRTRGAKMARRRKGNSNSGFGGITSSRNIVGTLAGAYIAPRLGISPKLGAAAGSYIYGKKGVVGAAVGYFAAPYLLGLLSGVTGNGSSSSLSWES